MNRIPKKLIEFDIKEIIQNEFYMFMRQYPHWYEDIDWDHWASSHRFHLQSMRASAKIIEYLIKKTREPQKIQNK